MRSTDVNPWTCQFICCYTPPSRLTVFYTANGDTVGGDLLFKFHLLLYTTKQANSIVYCERGYSGRDGTHQYRRRHYDLMEYILFREKEDPSTPSCLEVETFYLNVYLTPIKRHMLFVLLALLVKQNHNNYMALSMAHLIQVVITKERKKESQHCPTHINTTYIIYYCLHLKPILSYNCKLQPTGL